MEVEYLRKLGLRVPSGNGTGPVVLHPRGYAGGAAPAAAVPVQASSDSSVMCQPCLPMKGYAKEPIKREGHPAWYQPNEGVDMGLKTFNSLTGEREVFKPMDGKKIRWYTCGPTVYDVAHMGHARAYLTFDILRRIMANYFNYEIKYQINITDIDDKIILRSRQNKLFADFTKEADSMKLPELKEVVDAALDVAEGKLAAKKPAQPDDKDARAKAEFEKLMPEYELKVGQFRELKVKVKAAEKSKDDLLKAAREPLMAKLDKERGATVTDHAIFDAHSRHYENEYFEDMDALGVKRPDVVTRISDYMDGRVQEFIEKLEDDGVVYNSSGSVYFDIDAFNKKGFCYRKLVPCSHTSAAEMEEGEGALADTGGEKRNPNDFALWKKSKPGEPAWDSRWGRGRPGWHIECSVMATSIMDEFLDIHAGGEDLKFPHHDNEMAQSEAYLGRQQWVNYFWHAGHLHIQGLKMSKSLKNFITIRQAMQTHTARQLRMMFLMNAWDKGMNYSDDAIGMAKAEERKIKHALGCLKFFKRKAHGGNKQGDREKALLTALKDTKEAVDVALKDNFNTSKSVEVISKLVGQCYQTFDALPEASLEPVGEVLDFVVHIMGVFGVENLSTSPDKEADWAKALDAFAQLREDVRTLGKEKAGNDKVQAAIASAKPAAAAASSAGLGALAAAFELFMKELGGCKTPQDLLKRCDEVRDKDMVELGVRLEDRGATGFVWMFEDTKTMVREAQEAEEKQAEAKAQKIIRSLDEKKKTLTIAEKNAVAPADVYRNQKDLYTEFDASGVPTKLASGEEISKSKAKDFTKGMATQTKEFEKLKKQAGELGIDGYLAKLRKEVSDIEATLKK